MKHEVPTKEEIRTTIQQVFNRCQEEQPNRIFSALVALVQMPYSPSDRRTYSQAPDYFEREMHEICEFSNRMNQFIRILPKVEPPDEKEAWFSSTLKTMVYCHITEADLPYLILLNLLRVLSGLDCCFTFYQRNPDDSPKENVDKNQKKRCRFPKGKIKEITRQDKNLKTGLGKILDGLLYEDYRNSFAHSQYTIEKEGHLIFTGSLTGMTPETIDSPKKLDILKPQDIDALYQGTNTYLGTFLECYRKAIRPFQDGKFHKHELSNKPLIWDAVRQQWTWHALA
jgi:hypothetical protein